MLSQNPAPPREHVDQGLEFRGWSLEPSWVPHVCPPLADVGFAHRAPHFLCSVLRALVVCTQLPAPSSPLPATGYSRYSLSPCAGGDEITRNRTSSLDSFLAWCRSPGAISSPCRAPSA